MIEWSNDLYILYTSVFYKNIRLVRYVLFVVGCYCMIIMVHQLKIIIHNK